MNLMTKPFRFGLSAAILVSLAAPVTADAACFRGVNLSGAEFGDRDGVAGQQYAYPSQEIVSYFAGKGMNTIRLPFLWERLQPELEGEFDAQELQRLEAAVEMIRSAGMIVILDPHDYANYDGNQIGSSEVSHQAFANLWKRLARQFANRPDVAFGLMNEPHDLAAERWLQSANAAIAAIRETGAENLVLVPGTDWTGAHSWQSNNAPIMLGVKDPGNNYAFEVHQYLDSNFSGQHASCPRADDANKAISEMTTWLRDNGQRGFLGEFGAGGSVECLVGLAGMVDQINAAKDVWTGWTYWVAGDWWGPEEPLNITPTASGDRIQLKALERPGLLDKACGGL